MEIKHLLRCTKCHETDPTKLTKHNKQKGKYFITRYYVCHTCNNLRARQYYALNKERCRNIIYQYNSRNVEKKKAHSILKYAIKKGVIKKPNNCEKCKISSRLEAHHNDYLKPLDVQWLCTSCHNKRHIH